MGEITNNNDTLAKQPLVSIIVITYNSSKYVLETLESAKAQTYQNIELIVSDDCSIDNTVEICREWIGKNKGRFVRTELITAEKNTGIPANCNRGVKAAQGDWVKLIAGDDALLPDCIRLNIEQILNNKNINLLQSNVLYFENIFDKTNFIKTSNIQDNPFFQKVNDIDQYRQILYGNKIIAPSMFIKRNVVFNIGGFDEDISLIEDLPFWTKALQNGYKIDYFDDVTVKYRIHNNHTSKQKIMSLNYAKSLLIYSKKYKNDNVNVLHYYAYNLSLYITIIYNTIGLSNKMPILDKLISFVTSKLRQII